MFTVYALRLKGDAEVRYVGQTRDATQRLRQLFSEGQAWARHSSGRWGDFGRWMCADRSSVEMVTVWRCADRDEARALERQTVLMLATLGHRLFNRHLVPAGLRLVAKAA